MYDKKTEDQLRQGRDASGCENIRWLMCICNQALAALWGVTTFPDKGDGCQEAVSPINTDEPEQFHVCLSADSDGSVSLNIRLSSGSVCRHLLKSWIIQITCTTHPIHIHQKHINDFFLLISQNAPAL